MKPAPMLNIPDVDFTEFVDKKVLENLLCHPELLGTWIDGYGIERNDRKQLKKQILSVGSFQKVLYL